MCRCSPRIKFLILSLLVIVGQAVNDDDFPHILTKSYNQTLNLSSNALLTCRIRNVAEHHVTWFKVDAVSSVSEPLAVGEQLFTIDTRYSVSSYSTTHDETVWSLEIYQVNLSDEGTYLCKIANRRVSVSVAIYLLIQIPMSLSPHYLYVELGHPVELNCSIFHFNDNSTLFPIHWQFYSHYHTNQSKPNDIQIRKQIQANTFNSYLIIHHAQIYHSGLWTCIYKRQRRTARLIVEKNLRQRQRVSALLSSSNISTRLRRSVTFLLSVLSLLNSMVR